ncbi:MAG TPA: molybdopterin-dependent oxidoreductase [Micromonosporaceae bacterium]
MTERSASAGAAAALAGLACAEAVAAWLGLPSLADGVARSVVDTTPRQVVDLTVRLLGQRDKPAVRLAVTGGVAAAGAATGLGSTRRVTAAAVGAAALAAAVTVHRDRRRPAGTVAVAALGAATTALAFQTLRRKRARTTRAVVAVTGLAALAAARAIRARHRLQHDSLTAGRPPGTGVAAPPPAPPPAAVADGAVADGAEQWGVATPLFTPLENLYAADVNLDPPLLDARRWRLEVTGLVERPYSFDLAELTALGTVDFDALLICIHNGLGGNRLGNLRWTGVPLARLLRAVRPAPYARTLVTRAFDGFDMSLSLTLLDEFDGYVVTGVAGRPLPAVNGYPARIMVPGIYGQYSGVKWVTQLHLTDRPPSDYWPRRGWPADPVRVRPMSRIDPPSAASAGATVTVTGVAWAPPSGVAAVEVAVGDGPWRPAELAAELAPAAWRRWRARLDLPAGRHVVRSRATAATGEVQDGRRRPPFPSGAGGYHEVSIDVAEDGGRRGA